MYLCTERLQKGYILVSISWCFISVL